jgi:hypothetical protein
VNADSLRVETVVDDDNSEDNESPFVQKTRKWLDYCDDNCETGEGNSGGGIEGIACGMIDMLLDESVENSPQDTSLDKHNKLAAYVESLEKAIKHLRNRNYYLESKLLDQESSE